MKTSTPFFSRTIIVIAIGLLPLAAAMALAFYYGEPEEE